MRVPLVAQACNPAAHSLQPCGAPPAALRKGARHPVRCTCLLWLLCRSAYRACYAHCLPWLLPTAVLRLR